MKKVIKYNDKVITLVPYNTILERDLLLYTSSEYDFDALFDIVKPCITLNKPHTINSLTKTEKTFILLELRSISVGEVLSFIKKCGECDEKYETEVAFSNVLKEGTLKDFKGIKLHEAFSEEYNDYCDIDIDELPVSDYDELIEYIDANRTSFNFEAESKCLHCNHINTILLKEEHIVQNLSEDTLSNFYQTIASMVYYGHYSKLDIDSMLPFERGIYLSLLNEELKKSNQSNQGGM